MLGWVAETTLVAAGLALVAALVGRLRPVGPTARHALWLIVLIKLMTPPFFSWPWPPPWGELHRYIVSDKSPSPTVDAAVAQTAWPQSAVPPRAPSSRAAPGAAIDPPKPKFDVRPAPSGD